MTRIPIVVFLALAPLAFGAATLALGMDANWDLRNYHYYNAYAFLTGRAGYDMLVAQVPEFFNPLIDVPFFVAAEAWPARLVGFLLGTIQGLNVLPLYGIAHRVLRIEPEGRRRGIAAILAILGMVGAGALSELGTTFYDNVVSLGPLTALWLIVRRSDSILRGTIHSAAAHLFLAGFVAGVAVGLKQPVVTWAIGLYLAFIFVPAPPARRLARAFVFGVGVLGGMGLSDGFWMLHLWRSYGNPLFPFFNQIFCSPWALPFDYRDVFYFPQSLAARVFFPFAYLLDPRLAAETDFRDLRILICFVALPLAGLAVAYRKLRRAPGGGKVEVPLETHYFLASFAMAYVAWVIMFCIYRYLVVSEMLAPLAIVLAIGLLPLSSRAAAAASASLLILSVMTMKVPDWGRVPWTERWVTVTPPRIEDPARTLVLITGHEPLSYLIPSFPPEVRFLRIHGGFTGPYEPAVRFNAEMRQIVSAHRGPIWALYNPNETAFAKEYLADYGLALDPAACQTVPSNIGYLPYFFCPVTPSG
ncbi:MAG TPA: hypothetical protein VI113_06135 [Alphaproteobacteria bacterium]